MKTKDKVYPKVTCPICSVEFEQTRKDKRFCSRKCQKNSAAKNPAKVKVRDRKRENCFATMAHYDRAAWLTYDTARLPEAERNLMYQKLLEAASGDNTVIRRILLDPKLLGAGNDSLAGRFSHDRKVGIKNIALQVYAFCMNNYGCSTKDCILDDGKPAKRLFVGDPVVDSSKPYEACEPSKKHVTILKSLTGLSRQAYHGMLVVEFEEKLAEVKLAA